MIKCRDAAGLISDSRERRLRLSERVGLRIHLILCRFCARYGRQVRFLGRLCERLEAGDQAHPPSEPEELSPDARERMEARLRD